MKNIKKYPYQEDKGFDNYVLTDNNNEIVGVSAGYERFIRGKYAKEDFVSNLKKIGLGNLEETLKQKNLLPIKYFHFIWDMDFVFLNTPINIEGLTCYYIIDIENKIPYLTQAMELPSFFYLLNLGQITVKGNVFTGKFTAYDHIGVKMIKPYATY